MKTITAAQFKVKCLSLFKEIASSRESFVITLHGQPVAELKPIHETSGQTTSGLIKTPNDVISQDVDLEAGYRMMAADESREIEALEWAEATVGDALK